MSCSPGRATIVGWWFGVSPRSAQGSSGWSVACPGISSDAGHAKPPESPAAGDGSGSDALTAPDPEDSAKAGLGSAKAGPDSAKAGPGSAKPKADPDSATA